MTKERPPADNPTTALFDLADHMASNYNKVIYIKYYAYTFISITLFLLLVLCVISIMQGNYASLIIIIAIMISGVMFLRLTIFTKDFLDDFNTNFEAIVSLRDVDPLPKVPKAKNKLQSLEFYLKNHDPSISSEIKNGLEIKNHVKIGSEIWPLVFQRQQKFMGPEGFFAVVREIKRQPKMADLIKFEKDLEEVTKKVILPNRAILLCRAPPTFDGLSEDLYAYLTEKNHFIVKNGKKQKVKLQLFVEHGGRYEIIPLIP